MAQPNQFWDRHAKGYAKRPVGDEAAYQKKLEITQGYLKSEMEVLEFGCGTGTTALHHAPFVKHIRAIDSSRNMLDIAEAKAESAGITNVTFEHASIDDLNDKDAVYDVVMAHSILHLLDNRDAVIAKIHRMLKPGGICVSSTICLGGMMSMLKPVIFVGRSFGLLPPVRFFPVEDLVAALTGAGFRIDHQWQPGKGKTVFIVAKKN